MKQSEEQILFIRNLHWTTTIGGSFQRSYAYKKDSSDTLKEDFRIALRKELEFIEFEYLENEVGSKVHLRNIKRLQAWSERFSSILNNEKLNFGICQKLLNLHIKGLWCLGFTTSPPPHFPVDRIIQERLRMNPIIAWTQIEDEDVYLDIIDRALIIAKKHNVNLAELELKVYNNTLKIQK
jgi:hypothetical protein